MILPRSIVSLEGREMPLVVNCPGCGKQVRTPDVVVGQLRCPRCRRLIELPASQTTQQDTLGLPLWAPSRKGGKARSLERQETDV